MSNINPTLAASEVVESAGPDLAALCLMEPTTNDINRDPRWVPHVEVAFSAETVQKLQEIGQKVEVVEDGAMFGGYQASIAILRAAPMLAPLKCVKMAKPQDIDFGLGRC